MEHSTPIGIEGSSKKELELCSGVEYFQALAKDIASTQAGDRVALMTMGFEPSEPLVDNILQELYAAADRRVEILLGVDAYAFLIDDSGIGPLLMPLPLGQSKYKRRLSALEQLGQKPTAAYNIINKPNRLFSNPYAGRSHIKASVVNNKVRIVGANLHKSERLDMVVGLEDSNIADWLYELSRQIIKTGNTAKVLGEEDQSYQIDDQTQILIDVGRPGYSLIFDEALRLIAEADETVLASFQFFPRGEISKQMVAAHGRGVDVRPFHNHLSKQNLLLGMRERLVKSSQRRLMPPEFFDGQLPKDVPALHSKALATEKAAMVGSHCYDDLGVSFGTAEMTLLREDPIFAQKVSRLLLSQTCGVELVPEIARPSVPAGTVRV